MEEHRLRTFGNKVLAREFRPNSEKIRGKWRKLHKNNPILNQGESDGCSM
jgi:hypothetical protein